MITYNDIYEALRKEKYAEELQKLSREFIKEVAEYVKEKEEVLGKKEDIFSEAIIKTKRQLENAISIFKELLLRRRKKLLNLAFIAKETGISKRDFENMLDFEKEMFEKIVKNLEESDKKVNEVMNGKEEKMKNALLLFKDNTEEFIGADGEVLGPYEKGELANLPAEISKILVESGKAELVEEE